MHALARAYTNTHVPFAHLHANTPGDVFIVFTIIVSRKAIFTILKKGGRFY